MILNFVNRILVPVDKSDLSLASQETAASIAKKIKASVTVLHVVSRISYGEPETAARILSGLDQEGQKIVAEAKAVFAEENVEAKTELLHEDDVADAISEFAENSDLIVMGAHGETEKDPYALGSVTEKVITHANCPIMIVKRTSALSNMLVCVDGSEPSTKALKYAASLAEKMGSKITLLNVQEERLHKSSLDVAKELGETVFATSLNAIEGEKAKVEKRLEFGAPSDTIVEVAQKGGYDLIVLGTRGLGTIKRSLLGSVSEGVSYKAHCSVLIVP